MNTNASFMNWVANCLAEYELYPEDMCKWNCRIYGQQELKEEFQRWNVEICSLKQAMATQDSKVAFKRSQKYHMDDIPKDHDPDYQVIDGSTSAKT